jgi:hypothetical protein
MFKNENGRIFEPNFDANGAMNSIATLNLLDQIAKWQTPLTAIIQNKSSKGSKLEKLIQGR